MSELDNLVADLTAAVAEALDTEAGLAAVVAVDVAVKYAHSIVMGAGGGGISRVARPVEEPFHQAAAPPVIGL
ncbi:hypothetical protein [Actinokineospora sp. HUAS TT18]|uniref:hypothetical protein n=1 Tax=Actinokineospora sp. HUAS TT18 TaxID=3447451 RepID=UPI003F51FFCB